MKLAVSGESHIQWDVEADGYAGGTMRSVRVPSGVPSGVLHANSGARMANDS